MLFEIFLRFAKLNFRNFFTFDFKGSHVLYADLLMILIRSPISDSNLRSPFPISISDL